MAICDVCKVEYEAKRATSRYCGATCRVKAGRLSVTDPAGVSVTDLSVTQPQSMNRKCGPISPNDIPTVQAVRVTADASGYIPLVIEQRQADV